MCIAFVYLLLYMVCTYKHLLLVNKQSITMCYQSSARCMRIQIPVYTLTSFYRILPFRQNVFGTPKQIKIK